MVSLILSDHLKECLAYDVVDVMSFAQAEAQPIPAAGVIDKETPAAQLGAPASCNKFPIGDNSSRP